MPSPEAPTLTRSTLLRTVGFAVAVALGAIAVWLIVIADSTKSMRIGVLAGIWGALLGAYSMFGSRRHAVEDDEPVARPAAPQPEPVPGAALELRSTGDVERIAEAAARRAFEGRLEELLRRELGREVSDLRSEIARLRQDLLEKVGGQLRLERIETTRVIGSDLEALQHEVRQLKQASESGMLHEFGLGTAPLRKIVEPAKVRPVSRSTAEAEDTPTPARTADAVRPVTDPRVVDERRPAQERVAAEDPARAATPTPAAAARVPEPQVPSRPVAPPLTRPVAPQAAPAPAAAAPTGAPAAPAAPTPAAASVAPAPAAAAAPAPAAAWSPPPAPYAHTASNGVTGPRLTSPHGSTPRTPATPPRQTETTGPIRRPPAAAQAAQPQPPAQPQQTAHSQQAAPARPPAASAPVPPPANRATPTPATTTPATTTPSRPAAAQPVGQPSGQPGPSSADPFASLPRIRPFTDFELDPIDPAPASPVAPPAPAYTGRRRRGDDSQPDAGRHAQGGAAPVAGVNGTHATNGTAHPAPTGPTPSPAPAAGGRRRRADDVADDDLLARLLSARGGAER